jgi:hypothetical protein
MSEALMFYPMLSEHHLANIGYTTEIPQFSYTESYEEFPLTLDGQTDSPRNFTAKMRDVRCSWYPETHDLVINKKCKMLSAYAVFGLDGIAASTATLGIALRWISSKSDERGVIPFGTITKSDCASVFELNHKFEKGKLKGSLKLQTILYLKDPGCCQKDESYFAQQPGTVLGVLDQAEIYIDGNGSIFPIVSVDAPGKPLWTVYYNDTCDPMHDPFDEENVEIRLNRAHPAYESLKIDVSLSESPMFLEVLSSALFVIVASAKESLGEDWNVVMNGENLEAGTIAAAMNHFVRKLQWDISSPAKLAESIKDFFEKSGTGGV